MELKFERGGVKLEVKGARGIVTLVGIGLTVAALFQELKRPPTERVWHGRVLGFVPYDFRLPTPERVRNEFWNPKSPNILSPHAFGVGWGINLGAVAKRFDLAA